jgi:RNA polymerase sigma factor (sigma-70 family)
MTPPSSRRGRARPHAAHRPVAASLNRRGTPLRAGGVNASSGTAAGQGGSGRPTSRSGGWPSGGRRCGRRLSGAGRWRTWLSPIHHSDAARNLGAPLTRITGVGLSDESLLAGLGSNDPQAAAAFVRRFQGRVFGLAYTVLGDRDAAGDVAQEAFVRAWRHAEVFDPRRGSVATWLLTITRNLALDAVRMRRAVPVDPGDLAGLQGGTAEPGPDQPILTTGELVRLRQAVAGLPEEQGRSLLLAVFHGLTAREISELDGLPLGTVKTRIRTALLKLRSALEVRDD